MYVCPAVAVDMVHMGVSAVNAMYTDCTSGPCSTLVLSRAATTPYVFVVNQARPASGLTVDLKSNNVVQRWSPKVCRGEGKVCKVIQGYAKLYKFMQGYTRLYKVKQGYTSGNISCIGSAYVGPVQ